MLWGCHPISHTVSVRQKVSEGVVLGSSDSFDGVWTKRYSNETDDGDETVRLMIFKAPTEMGKGEKFLLFKNEKKYMIIEFLDSGLRKHHIVGSIEKFESLKIKLGVPDTIKLLPINQ